MPRLKLLGPFTQIILMQGLPASGRISDEQLKIIPEGGILVQKGRVIQTGHYQNLKKQNAQSDAEICEYDRPLVLIPGLIDAHTHICYAGSRHHDYAKRLSGISYIEIAKQGGGIMDTVWKTRAASLADLIKSLTARCDAQLANGITTCEVKSGYGLDVQNELKMLQAIRSVNGRHTIDLVPTALPAHVCPTEFDHPDEYIEMVIRELLPQIRKKNLAERADIYIDAGAFTAKQAEVYLKAARDLGFSLTVHGDQFSTGGSRLAAAFRAVSVDHLEVSGPDEIRQLAEKQIIGIVLPGACMGLGVPFAPARSMIDAGMTVAIASDWNPGSAPMGDLLAQASVLCAYEKLSLAETLAGITIHAARALELTDRGSLENGNLADLVAFPCSDYREIFYRQGALKPVHIWKNGEQVK